MKAYNIGPSRWGCKLPLSEGLPLTKDGSSAMVIGSDITPCASSFQSHIEDLGCNIVLPHITPNVRQVDRPRRNPANVWAYHDFHPKSPSRAYSADSSINQRKISPYRSRRLWTCMGGRACIQLGGCRGWPVLGRTCFAGPTRRVALERLQVHWLIEVFL